MAFQITSKLWNTHHHPENVEEAVNKTLKDLQTDYLDLYLVRQYLYSSPDPTDNPRSTGPWHSSTRTLSSLP